jgi:hypothetical protein
MPREGLGGVGMLAGGLMCLGWSIVLMLEEETPKGNEGGGWIGGGVGGVGLRGEMDSRGEVSGKAGG